MGGLTCGKPWPGRRSPGRRSPGRRSPAAARYPGTERELPERFEPMHSELLPGLDPEPMAGPAGPPVPGGSDPVTYGPESYGAPTSYDPAGHGGRRLMIRATPTCTGRRTTRRTPTVRPSRTGPTIPTTRPTPTARPTCTARPSRARDQP